MALPLQISNVGSDSYIGRLGVGRIMQGTLEAKKEIGLSAGPGTPLARVKVGNPLCPTRPRGNAPLQLVLRTVTHRDDTVTLRDAS